MQLQCPLVGFASVTQAYQGVTKCIVGVPHSWGTWKSVLCSSRAVHPWTQRTEGISAAMGEKKNRNQGNDGTALNNILGNRIRRKKGLNQKFQRYAASPSLASVFARRKLQRRAPPVCVQTSEWCCVSENVMSSYGLTGWMLYAVENQHFM